MTYRVIPYGTRILGYQADPAAIVDSWMARTVTPPLDAAPRGRHVQYYKVSAHL
jgi:hypothetical protein